MHLFEPFPPFYSHTVQREQTGAAIVILSHPPLLIGFIF
jgi:hypothetical protein